MLEFGHAIQYTGLLNGLNTSLVSILKLPCSMSILPPSTNPKNTPTLKPDFTVLCEN